MKIAVVFGTRPEAIKMAPVVAALKETPGVRAVVIATAQHRDMLDQVMGIFGIVPDVDLDLMRPGQTLDGITTRVITETGKALDELRPDMVLVQGDTTTVFAAALASFYRKIPVGHVEAGLRAHHRYEPFPEEINRRLAGTLSSLHFAPTRWAAGNLLREGVDPSSVHVTGNPVVDSLEFISRNTAAPDFPFLDPSRKLVVMTAHRRESFGEPLRDVFRAVAEVASARGDAQFVYPVHPNPHVRSAAADVFGKRAVADLESGMPGEMGPAITLLPPIDYVSMIHLMKLSRLLLTDSGGMQEEGTALGKPVLVLRDRTERPEAVEAGCARLVGTDRGKMVSSLYELLDDTPAYAAMSKPSPVFGDGAAGRRIAQLCARFLAAKGLEPGPPGSP